MKGGGEGGGGGGRSRQGAVGSLFTENKNKIGLFTVHGWVD